MRHRRFGVAPAIAYWCDACFVNTSVVLDGAVIGTFTGSLAQVLSRLLEGTVTSLNGKQPKSR
jgi:hypothetical protein